MKGQPAILKVLGTIVEAIIVVLIMWMFVGVTVFHFRHPWATNTETIMNMDKALGFRKVSIKELREEQ